MLAQQAEVYFIVNQLMHNASPVCQAHIIRQEVHIKPDQPNAEVVHELSMLRKPTSEED